MPRRWTLEEEAAKFKELSELYIAQNRTLAEIAIILGIAPQTVFKRLLRFSIRTNPREKLTYAARLRTDIRIPGVYSSELAEFFGIILGDGHISHYQVLVTLGNKEISYVQYVAQLIERLFCVSAKISTSPKGHHTVYVGSRALAEWLRSHGLISHKVQGQVGVPLWIYKETEFMVRFVRGFFDTDGSVYRLRFGLQISFTNRAIPLLDTTREILVRLGFHPSFRSGYQLYLTRREDVRHFFAEIAPANHKHTERFEVFSQAVMRR